MIQHKKNWQNYKLGLIYNYFSDILSVCKKDGIFTSRLILLTYILFKIRHFPVMCPKFLCKENIRQKDYQDAGQEGGVTRGIAQ